MAYLKLTMRKITEIFRLKFGLGLSLRVVALSLNVGYGTVANYIKCTKGVGLDLLLRADIDERSLGRLLIPSTGATVHSGFIDLDYLSIYQELKSPIVTKLLQWQEYRERNLDTVVTRDAQLFVAAWGHPVSPMLKPSGAEPGGLHQRPCACL